jgi:hypothetical protein
MKDNVRYSRLFAQYQEEYVEKIMSRIVHVSVSIALWSVRNHIYIVKIIGRQVY